MNIFEIIKNNYNIDRELENIKKLLEEKFLYKVCYPDFLGPQCLFGKTTYYNIISIFDKYLSEWKSRNEITSFDDFYKRIAGAYNSNHNLYEYRHILVLECYINVINFVFLIIDKEGYKFEECKKNILDGNIDILLDHLNYQKLFNKEMEQILLIPKNPEVIAVISDIENIEIANAIFKYNHYSLKGNIAEKRNLLIAIFNEYNTYLHNPVGGFAKEFKMATFLENNCQIRHNNKSGDDKKEYVSNMEDKELENMYDETYQLVLFCILAKKNTDRMKLLQEKQKLITDKS